MRQAISLENHTPRAGWLPRVEEAGLVWHGAGSEPYWVEDQHLALSLKAAHDGRAHQTAVAGDKDPGMRRQQGFTHDDSVPDSPLV